MSDGITLPFFGYRVKGGDGSLFLQVNETLFMPLFTTYDNAMLFGERIGIDGPPTTLATAPAVRRFVTATCGVSFRIIFDPIAPDFGDYLVCDCEDLLASLVVSIDSM